MFKPLLRGAAPLLLALATTTAPAQTAPPITAADMMRHIERLASDEFQGRAPGTEGERLTINYIAEQLAARGAEPAGEGGTWFQPVRLVERRPGPRHPALDGAGRRGRFSDRRHRPDRQGGERDHRRRAGGLRRPRRAHARARHRPARRRRPQRRGRADHASAAAGRARLSLARRAHPDGRPRPAPPR